MKRLLFFILTLLISIGSMSQGNYFGTRAYKLATLSDFANLSIGTTTAWFKMAVTPIGGSVIHESGFVARAGTLPTITTYDSKAIVGSRWIGNYIGGSSSNAFLYNLLPNTYYFVRGYAKNEAGVVYTDLIAITTQNNVGFPSVVMDYVQNVSTSSADWQGYAINTGGGTISEKGFCWNTFGSPTKLDNYVAISSGNGTFNYTKTGLTPNTTYFVSAYATNEAGTAYSQHIEFKTTQTINSPTVTTASASSITNNSAISGGNVTSDGGASVTSRGVCWSTNQNPTIADSKTIDGTGSGSFTSNIINLLGNTTYYARAYATNSVGTSYGSQISFTTTDALIVAINSISNIQQTSFDISSNVSNNTCGVVQVGTVVSSSTSLPTTVNYDVKRIYQSSYSGNGDWVYSVTGLTTATTYYVRSYITTETCGTFYSNTSTITTASNLVIVTTNNVTNITQTTATSGGIITANGQTITSKGVCWNTTGMPTTSNSKTVDGSGSTSFMSSITGLSANSTYYIRAYATTSTETFYGNQVSFTTLQNFIVTLDSYKDPFSNTTEMWSSSINIYNTVVSSPKQVIEKGVCIGTSQAPTVSNIKVLSWGNSIGIGSYFSQAGGCILNYNTMYYARAYAINSVGEIVYSANEISFTTLCGFAQPFISFSTVFYSLVMQSGDLNMIDGGVIWSTNSNPTLANYTGIRSYTNDVIGKCSYTISNVTLNGLVSGQTYYFTIYIVNSSGTFYGKVLSITI